MADQQQPLRFTRIYLKNWRNFAEVEVELPQRAFLVGANASGKSNLLDALRFLGEIATLGSGGLIAAVRRRGGVENIRRIGVTKIKPTIVRVEIGNDDNPHFWSYELGFAQGIAVYSGNGNNQLRRLFAEGEPVILGETVMHDGKQLITRSYDVFQPNDAQPPNQSYLEQEHISSQFKELNTFLASVRYRHVVPQLMRKPNDTSRGDSDFYGEALLGNIADTILVEGNGKLQAVEEVVKALVPELVELRAERGTFDTPHLYARYLPSGYKGKATWLREDQLSDGTLRLIGLLWAVQDGNGPLLLEEPELSLHPALVRYIPGMLYGVNPDRQTLVTTHTPALLYDESISPHELLLLTPSEAGTTIQPASLLSDVRVLLEAGVSLSDIAASETAPPQANQLLTFGG